MLDLNKYSVSLEAGFTNRFEAQKNYNRKNMNVLDSYFYELLIYQQRKFGGKPFFYQLKYIMKDTGLGRRAIETLIKKFKDLGILTIIDNKEDKFNKRYFQVELNGVLKNIDYVYDMSGYSNNHQYLTHKEEMIKKITHLFSRRRYTPKEMEDLCEEIIDYATYE